MSPQPPRRERIRRSLYSTLGGSTAIGAALVATAVAAMGCSGRDPRPNVLLVVVTGLRADHVSSYGYPRTTTPSIDALAAEGALFQTAIAPAGWGPSSQASMLTGLYPSEHAVSFDHPIIEGSLQTVAEGLKASGYATFAASADPAIGPRSGFGQGFDRFVEIDPAAEGLPDEGASRVESELLGWLDSRASDGSPFFAYLVMVNPQLPFNPPGEYRQKYLDRPVPLPRLERLSELWIPFARQINLEVATISEDDLRAMTGLYDGEVGYADYRLGRIVEGLRGDGLLDGTLVIVTSDAGEDLAEHGVIADASSLFDSIIHVPLVMRLPERIAAGLRVADQVQTHDVAGAIAKLTAADWRPGSGEPPMPLRAVAVSEARFEPAALRYYQSIAPGVDLSPYERNLLSVRTPELKYVLTSRNTAALFDLKADPGERASVLDSRQDDAAQMAGRLGEWIARLSAPAWPQGPPSGERGQPAAAGQPAPAGSGVPAAEGR